MKKILLILLSITSVLFGCSKTSPTSSIHPTINATQPVVNESQSGEWQPFDPDPSQMSAEKTQESTDQTTQDANAGGQSETDLAKAAQNPIANMISLPFQNNTIFNVGPERKTANVLNIQPVIPFKLSDELNLITRTIAPIVYRPEFGPEDDSEFGLGDVSFSAFFSPAEPNDLGITWGFGPILSFPTATDDTLGSEKWSAGPTFVALRVDGPWVYGGLVNQLWSYAGDDDRDDVNQTLLQPFINYNFPDFYLTSAPIITANWEADSDNTWTVPLGGGIGKIFRIGKQPINASIQAYYNVEHPDDAGNWSLRLQVQFLFPKM